MASPDIFQKTFSENFLATTYYLLRQGRISEDFNIFAKMYLHLQHLTEKHFSDTLVNYSDHVTTTEISLKSFGSKHIPGTFQIPTKKYPLKSTRKIYLIFVFLVLFTFDMFPNHIMWLQTASLRNKRSDFNFKIGMFFN